MFPEDVLLSAIAHCEAAFPREGCGVFVERADRSLVARPMANVIDRYHARDPARFPRTSETAYLFNPMEQQQVFEEVERSGGRIHTVFHSHAKVGAYFSAEDKVNALADGQPLLPGVDYLVISVRSVKADDLKLFTWDGSDWVERSIPLPRRP